MFKDSKHLKLNVFFSPLLIFFSRELFFWLLLCSYFSDFFLLQSICLPKFSVPTATNFLSDWNSTKFLSVPPPLHSLVAKVAHAAVPLRGPVELVDLLDVEAVNKLLPDLGPQPVTKHHPDTVPGRKQDCNKLNWGYRIPVQLWQVKS